MKRAIIPIVGFVFALIISGGSFLFVKAEQSTLPQGLIGYWNFDEGSGNTAGDSSGSNNPGTLTNSPVWVGGKLGKALSFDGVDDYVEIGDKQSLDGPSNLSISLWLQTNTSHTGALVNKYENGQNNGYYLAVGSKFSSSDKITFFVDGTSEDIVITNNSITDGQWHNLVAVYQSGVGPKIFIDGVEQAGARTGTPQDSVGTTPGRSFRIGQYSPGGHSFYYKGLMDEVRVYNRVLSNSEVNELYTSTIATAPPSNPTPSACTSWAYSDWSNCSVNGQQTRSVTSSSPNGCQGGSPVLTQACTYSQTCTSWTYSEWNACSPNGLQTRTIVNKSPAGCSGGSPTVSQSCTYNPPPQQTPILPQGLLGGWNFDEGAGDTASDSSGYNNSGALVGNPTWVDGKSGKALSFDGVDDYVEVGDRSNLNIRKEISFSLWFKANASQVGPLVNKYDVRSPDNGYYVGLSKRLSSGGTISSIFANKDSTNEFVTHQSFLDYQWHHLVVIYRPDGVSQPKIYLDRIEQSGTNIGPTLTTIGEPVGSNFRIGRYSDDAHSFYFKGLIDDVRIYNKILTADEIGALYGESTPICYADKWTCAEWNQCAIDGRQSRSCTKVFDCAAVDTPSPDTTQSCAPPPKESIPEKPKQLCSEDKWECANWGQCSLDGVQRRSCRKVFNCADVESDIPDTSQSCTPPITSRPPPEQPPISDSINREQILKATVKLFCPINKTTGKQGSGTVIDQFGSILTNRHVVEGTIGSCLVGVIENEDDTPIYTEVADVKNVSRDASLNGDMAIVKIRNVDQKTFPFIDISKGNSSTLRSGDTILPFGYPREDDFGETITFTEGPYSGKGTTITVDRRKFNVSGFFKTTATIEHGNSGGGAYQKKTGNFMGIPTLGVNKVNYILSVNNIKSWLNSFSRAYSPLNNNFSQIANYYSAPVSIDSISLSDLRTIDSSKPVVVIYSNRDKRKILVSTNNIFSVAAPMFHIASDQPASGFYVYFGTNKNTDPVKNGKFIASPDYSPTIKKQGVYYLIVKAKTEEGGVGQRMTTEYRFKK